MKEIIDNTEGMKEYREELYESSELKIVKVTHYEKIIEEGIVIKDKEGKPFVTTLRPMLVMHFTEGDEYVHNFQSEEEMQIFIDGNLKHAQEL